jgi:hypothetical protein
VGIGYVHKVAVTKNRVVASKPSAASLPVVAAAAPQPEPASRNQGMLGRVEETMDWLADKAGGGPAPKAIRPER